MGVPGGFVVAGFTYVFERPRQILQRNLGIVIALVHGSPKTYFSIKLARRAGSRKKAFDFRQPAALRGLNALAFTERREVLATQTGTS